MEFVWHCEFDRLFQTLSPYHAWYLSPAQMCPSPRWNMHQDAAKVRFLCQECNHGWTSMKGRVVFWFVLTVNGEGFVNFKIFGQQCQKCRNGRFEHAMWYPEEVVKVLYNVYNRVGQCYYGFQTPIFRKERRGGKPRTQHPADLCQACKIGICSKQKTVSSPPPNQQQNHMPAG